MTGKKMVYALWVASRRFAESQPEELQLVYNRIHGAFQTFRSEASRKDAAIREILPQKPAFTYEQLEEYLGPIIRWDLTNEYLDGLRTFYKLAHEMNLIDHVPEIEFAAVQRSCPAQTNRHEKDALTFNARASFLLLSSILYLRTAHAIALP